MSSSSSADAECCENCSSNFGIFKRKKVCNLCNQAFCQFCVNRRNSCENSVPTTTTATDSNANDRICVICRSICSPHTTTDDLMKLKLKHLKSFLTHANIPIGTCKDKRDLAELIMRNHEKFRFREAPAPPPSGQQHNQAPNTSGGNQFNNTINNFMSNVQDFVNFNLGSVLNPNNNASNVGGNPNANNNNNNSNSQPPPQAQQQQQPNYTIPSNFNSVFNLIGEQLPNVIQNTLGNNLFNFSGASSAGNAPHGSSSSNARTGSTSDSDTANNRQSSRPMLKAKDYRAIGIRVGDKLKITAELKRLNSSSMSNEPRQQTSRNESSSQSQPPRTTSEAASNFASSSSSAPSTANVKRRPSLSDLKNEDAIEDLSVKQLKELLALNFVEFKGCCERRELIEKARRLYRSHQENKMREQELNNQSSSVHGATSDYSASENDVCKICMESLIDCVLLDCGHMVSCIKCGKQLAECPICRQNVVRVVRVFKS